MLLILRKLYHIKTHYTNSIIGTFSISRYWRVCFNMVLDRGVEPLLLGWKPSVLTDRRIEYSGDFLSEESHRTFCCFMLSIYLRLREDFRSDTIIHQLTLKVNNLLWKSTTYFESQQLNGIWSRILTDDALSDTDLQSVAFEHSAIQT